MYNVKSWLTYLISILSISRDRQAWSEHHHRSCVKFSTNMQRKTLKARNIWQVRISSEDSLGSFQTKISMRYKMKNFPFIQTLIEEKQKIEKSNDLVDIAKNRASEPRECVVNCSLSADESKKWVMLLLKLVLLFLAHD